MERCETCGWEIDGIRRRMVRVEDVIVCQDCYMTEDGVEMTGRELAHADWWYENQRECNMGV